MSEPTDSTNVTPTISPDFGDQSADIKITSADGTLFYIHSYYLKANR